VKPAKWPATLDGWIDRVVPVGAMDQLAPESRATILRCIFDHLSVIEQLVWVMVYGSEPPANTIEPGKPFTASTESNVSIGALSGAIESASAQPAESP